MPRPCPRTVDAPIRILGLEWDDWAVLSGVLLFFLLAWSPGVAVAVTPPLLIGLRSVKKAQPPGIVLHRFWVWRVIRVPGFPPAPGRRGSLWSPWA